MRLHHVIPLFAALAATASVITGCAVSARLGQPAGAESRSAYVEEDVGAPRTTVRTVPSEARSSPAPVETVPTRVEKNYY